VPGPGIEIIQHRHRYAVVWPSVHPEGRPYVWVGRLGIPGPRHLPMLPERWVDGLSEAPGHERTTGWTDPHLDDLIEHGIPAGVNQDEALRDVVWKLRGAEVGRMATYVVWYSIVAKTLLTRSGEPWTMRDFDRHWAGADAKMPAPLTVLEPPPAAKPDSPLLTRSQLRSLPAPEPLIENTIDLRTVALVAGYWGTLKSFIALDWAACIATGKPWMGRDIKQGPVLYVAAEGAYGIGPRLDAWEYAWWQSRLVPDDMFAVYPRPINLLDITQVATLVALADGRRFVVVDTLARCLVGGDEDKARDMGVAVDALYKVRNATRDGTVAVLHHTGKDKVTTRGSSALEAGVDTVYATEGGAERVTLTRMKRKDGPVEDKLDLTLHKHLESGVISIHTGAGQTDNEKKLLSTMLSSFALTGASKADLRNASGLAPASFHRALQALLYGGFIRDAGSERRPFYRIGDPQ
jgi:hypothetical protein